MNAPRPGVLHNRQRADSWVDAAQILAACGAIIAGTLQNALVTISKSESFDSIDDTFVGILLLISILNLRRARGAVIVCSLAWLTICVIAVVFRGTQLSIAIFLCRQVLIPVVLLVCGSTLSRDAWIRICRVALVVACANAAYIFLEVFGIRLLDPTVTAEMNNVWVQNGLPGYYYGYDLNNNLVIRAGGLLLNPPTAGIVVGFGTVAAVSVIMRTRLKYLIVILLTVATYYTGSRAGLLIVASAFLVPFMMRKLGPTIGITLSSAVAVAFGIAVSGTGKSTAHADGLAGGLADAFNFPAGRGFGYAGNHADPNLVQSSESLAGIAFSACGVVAVGLVLCLAARLFALVIEREILAAAAFGGLLSSLFAESASALDATVPLWLACGVSLSASVATAATSGLARRTPLERQG